MKKLFYFAMALGLVACQAEKVDVNGGDEDGVQNYITVNIVSTPDNGTRAGGDTQSGDPSATYEEGYASENTVSAVRLYFFDDNGNAAAIKKDPATGNYLNYFDWTPIQNGSAAMPNVEKTIAATVIIKTKDGDKLPTKIVALINPATEGLASGSSLSLSDLRNRVKDYAADANGAEDFVMTNSVYAEGSNEMAATVVSKENYASSEEGAKQNPVKIYVERNVAKVRVKFADNIVGANNRIALKDKEDKNIVVDGKQVYLQISNWNLTAYTTEGYLSKHIDAANWSTTNPFGPTAAAWNHAPYFRSFWAQNTDTAQQNWITYNEITTGGNGVPAGKGYGDTDNSKVLYTNENAPAVKVTTEEAGNVEKFTKVILAGVLCDENGTAIEVTKFAGSTIVGENNLKAELLNYLKNNGEMLYTFEETIDAGNGAKLTTARSLAAGDVMFKTAKDADVLEDGESNPGHYYVYLQLTEDAAKLKWAATDDKDAFDKAVVEDVDAYFIEYIGKAQIFKSGMTYYYFPIEHLGNSGEYGYYGVVRNHIYNSTISKITGLGTPVYNPNEKIWPEHTVDEDTYIAAQINILSWRIVDHSYDLVW